MALNYITTQAKLRVEVAKILAASLAQCGVQVNVQYLSPGDLYAPGPDGVLFGRKFDLAQFAWEAGLQPSCSLYESSQIPAAANQWTTVNVTGYSSPAYDAACEAARRAMPGTPDYAGKNQAVLRLFAQELPSIPLYFRPKIAISRPDLFGFTLDVTARSALWGLESINYGDQCPK